MYAVSACFESVCFRVHPWRRLFPAATLQLRVSRHVPAHLSSGPSAARWVLDFVIEGNRREVECHVLGRSVIRMRPAEYVPRDVYLLQGDLQKFQRLSASARLPGNERGLVIMRSIAGFQKQVRAGGVGSLRHDNVLHVDFARARTAARMSAVAPLSRAESP